MRNSKDKKELLSKEDRESVAFLLHQYADENFDEPLTNLQALILTDFIEKNIGKFFYNKGVEDSLSFMKDKVDDLYSILKD